MIATLLLSACAMAQSPHVETPSQEFVTTPVYSEKANLVFISSSWPKRHLLAIRPDGNGNVTETHVVWRDEKGAFTCHQ